MCLSLDGQNESGDAVHGDCHRDFDSDHVVWWFGVVQLLVSSGPEQYVQSLVGPSVPVRFPCVAFLGPAHEQVAGENSVYVSSG